MLPFSNFAIKNILAQKICWGSSPHFYDIGYKQGLT